jgi:hypothetical protein
LEHIIECRNLDFFKEDFPKSDVITMAHILHNWGFEAKQLLIRKAFDALNEGGVLIIVEELIDSNRRERLQGMITSLLMRLANEKAFDFTEADFSCWCQDAGFTRTEFIHLTESNYAGIAYK